MHASIPTTYRGIRFRSRLEARWAAYFDSGNNAPWTEWKYEPVDFPGWIPDFSLQCEPPMRTHLVEIKPIYDVYPFLESSAWTKITRALQADTALAKNFGTILLLGVSPEHMWLLPILEDHPGFQIFPPDYKDWRASWAEAGNIVQWKAPR